MFANLLFFLLFFLGGGGERVHLQASVFLMDAPKEKKSLFLSSAAKSNRPSVRPKKLGKKSS